MGTWEHGNMGTWVCGMRAWCAGALLIGFAACATTPQTRAPSPALLYVCNQSDATVTLIDTKTNEIIRTVDLKQLGFSANAKPHHIQVEPDGSFWYVTLIGENRIVKIDRNDRVAGAATFETPGMMALDPGSDLLFVGRSMTAVNPPKRIGAVKRSDMSIEEIDVLLPRPHALVIDAADRTVYTGSLAANQIAAVDVVTQRVEVSNVAGPPHSLMQYALSPDGTTLVAAGELSAQLLFFDVTDRMQPKLVRSLAVAAQPFDPVYTRDGRYVVLGNKAANTITIVDTRTHELKLLRGPGIAQPHATATSGDGRWIYVSNNNLNQPAGAHDMHAGHASPGQPAGQGTIVVIDAKTLEIAKIIEVGRNATGVAVPPRR
ncbi:MAG: YncE family protein [Gemmatimonadota bacterium]